MIFCRMSSSVVCEASLAVEQIRRMRGLYGLFDSLADPSANLPPTADNRGLSRAARSSESWYPRNCGERTHPMGNVARRGCASPRILFFQILAHEGEVPVVEEAQCLEIAHLCVLGKLKKWYVACDVSTSGPRRQTFQRILIWIYTE
jgi:hypothetical protein